MRSRSRAARRRITSRSSSRVSPRSTGASPASRRASRRRMFRGIQHCALVVSDLERSRRFYRDALGLTEIERPASFAFAGAWFQAGDDEVHLILEGDTTMRAGASEAGPALGVGLVTHLALEVDDLGAMLARLHERGVEIGGGPMPRGDGV